MQLDNIQKQLEELLIQVRQDDSLGEELQENLSELIMATAADTTPGNLEALSIVLQKLADSEKYMAAMTTIQNLSSEE